VGKGRPTPKRSEKERRRSGPAAPPPTTRKEAAARQRDKAKEDRQRARSGVQRGEERFLPKRDAGPVRRLVRDTVDSRRNLAVLLLPIALVLVVAQFTGSVPVLRVATLLWFVGLLAVFIDLVVLAVGIRRKVAEGFPDGLPDGQRRGHVGYGLLRSTVLRRWRMPAPAVTPGRKR
jgi:hypothetical protein